MVQQDKKTTVNPKDFLPPTRAKAPWESRNDGVHERVNFDDTIWGFDLAGGAHYNVPLTVTRVRDDSRAQKAGIKAGDKLLKINDISTETLTLREAHDMIVSSGIHIRLAVTAPEDTETTYNSWEDPLPERHEKVQKVEKPKKRKKCIFETKTTWNLQWPWVSLPKTIYKESNCHMVPSKFENKYGQSSFLPVHVRDDIPFEPITIRRRSFIKYEEVTEEPEE